MNPLAIQSPWMLCLLGLVPVLGLLQMRARRLRRRVVVHMTAGPPSSSIVRDALRLAALALLMLALSRPGYAPERQPVSQSGRDVVFAIDVSRSMLARDARPSRLEAAKQGVRDALESFRTERAGLVIYAGSATILCPLTHDYDFVRYMLDHATPRAVDFGGTTLLSAVEKSVDNLFSDQRRGMQDLVVLSDGEDHGPEMARVAELLADAEADLLLIGLGDATVGSRIPVTNDDGVETYLKHDEEFVTTRLNQGTFERLVTELPGSSYMQAGTGPFDGALVYADYVADKPVEGAVGTDGFVVYREAGLPIVAMALVVLLFAEWWVGRRGAAVVAALLAVGLTGTAEAADTGERFAQAKSQQEDGRFSEALELYDALDGAVGEPPRQAALRFNHGLCHLALAEAAAADAPENALAHARSAQRDFLKAIRMNPALKRAGRRLDSTARRIAVFEKAVAEKEEKERKSREQIAALIELLEKLRDDQVALHKDLLAESSRKRRTPTTKNERQFIDRQDELTETGRTIREMMQAIEQSVSGDGSATGELMKEPLRIMAEVVADQEAAATKLATRADWKQAGTLQQEAVSGIEAILKLLAQDPPDESDPEDYDEDEQWEMDEYADEGSPSSMPMSGDLAAGSEMQALPVPNYSVEDMLMEEQGNMQFRQQQRAKANEGKVKKDW